MVTIIPFEENDIELNLDLLALDLTNDPKPAIFHGKAPVLEKEKPVVALLSALSGMGVKEAHAQGGAEVVYFFINDHLGTPQMVLDETGGIVWSADYQPFGEVDETVNTLVNNFRFAGQYYDQETGLHYNWHRYYDTGTGRYLRADLIGLSGGVNLFAYANVNPTNLIDPLGLITLPELYAKVEMFLKPYTVGGALVVTGGVTAVAGTNLMVVGYGSVTVTGPAGVLAGTAGLAVTAVGGTTFMLGLDVYSDELRYRFNLPSWFDVFEGFELLPKDIHENGRPEDECQ